jgi:hypothetical protein
VALASKKTNSHFIQNGFIGWQYCSIALEQLPLNIEAIFAILNVWNRTPRLRMTEKTIDKLNYLKTANLYKPAGTGSFLNILELPTLAQPFMEVAMQSDISKLCADFLRKYSLYTSNEKLKATHARELAAAFFGYKSHAALLADQDYPLYNIEKAKVLVPDVDRMDDRRRSLEGLPKGLPNSEKIAEEIVAFLEREQLFRGDIWWLFGTLEAYIIEQFLPVNDAFVMDDLSGQMAETNALFDEMHYEEAEIVEDNGELTITVSGECIGTSDPDKPFSGDSIDMTITIEMTRVAGRNLYSRPTMGASGEVNWDWADIE